MTARQETPALLLVGGAGTLGRQAARTLRARHLDQPLIIAGRNLDKAEALARDLGRAAAVRVDLDRPDLGLAETGAIAAVGMFAKDEGLNGLRFAAAKDAAYMAVSEYAVEVAPLMARLGSAANRTPALLLGHHLGGLVTLAGLHFAKAFSRVDAISIGAVFDPDDLGGETAQVDSQRLALATPQPLVLRDGKWLWATGEAMARDFAGIDGTMHAGQAISLLDVVSLAGATDARSVRFDVALRTGPQAERRRHEVVLDISGEISGRSAVRRYGIADDAFHASVSGHGVALAMERLAGLDGAAKLRPGLHLPEAVLDPGRFVTELRGFGVRIEALPS